MTTTEALAKLFAVTARGGAKTSLLVKDYFWDSDSGEWQEKPDTNNYLAIGKINDTLVIVDNPDGHAIGITLIGDDAQMIREWWDLLTEEDEDEEDN